MSSPIPAHILAQFAGRPVQRMEWLDEYRVQISLPDRTVVRVIGTAEGQAAWLSWAEELEERRLAETPAR